MPPPPSISLSPALACRLQAWRRQLAAAAGEVPPFGRSTPPGRRSLLCRAEQQQQQQTNSGIGSDGDQGSGAPINKQVISKHMDDRLYGYLLEHTREPPVLASLRAATAEQFPTGARMQISPEQGAFMGWLVGTLGAKRIIEVGTFTGYSSIAMALALPPGSTLLACDRDPRAMVLAREYWGTAGVADKIDERLGPASETLDSLLADPSQHASYDFAFIDADKKGYRAYYEQLLRLVRPGGVIAVDNVLWYGKVADPEVADKNTEALRELNAFLLRDERVAFSLVPVGDGIALCTCPAAAALVTQPSPAAPQCPRVDPSALRHGVWGNSWRQWGLIMLAFGALYAVLAGYQTGMLFAALGIRGDDYRTMSNKWFGPFDTYLFTADSQNVLGWTEQPQYFNRPDGCTAQQRQVGLPGFPDQLITEPTGVLECSNGDNQWRWTVYPWVQATNGLGNYPGCSNPNGTAGTFSSYLTQASSPAAEDAAVNNGTAAAGAEWVCQNGVPL
ncbi:hypothetical protein ABPG77_007918 [Micractinium sp. CCAP 211/92]